jgi:hypothetical protein
MNHQEAVELQAAVKYVLGELPPAERDSFEEHYFDCGECALDVKAAAGFVDVGRVFLRTKRLEDAAAKGAGEQRGWFLWLRPAFAVPAMLVLVAIIGYQNLITLPRMQAGGSASTAQVFSSFSLVAANTRSERGDEAVKVQVQKNETFALDFDFLPERHFDHYLCRVQDEAGRVVRQGGIPVEKEKQEVHLLVPKGVERPGKYSVVIVGDPGEKGQWLPTNEVSRLNFFVDFQR